jgi:hypothetical protein
MNNKINKLLVPGVFGCRKREVLASVAMRKFPEFSSAAKERQIQVPVDAGMPYFPGDLG